MVDHDVVPLHVRDHEEVPTACCHKYLPVSLRLLLDAWVSLCRNGADYGELLGAGILSGLIFIVTLVILIVSPLSCSDL